jgi:heat shock protein HslJ/uncharacterized membrane protein
MKVPALMLIPFMLAFVASGPAERNNTMTANEQQGNDSWYQLYGQGIDFAAMGREPSWTLKIDKEKFIEFTTSSGIRITVPPVEPIRAQDANVLLYRGTSESGSLEVTINQSDCQENKNVRRLPFSVRIRFKAGKDTEFTEVKGCGNYIANPRLHNIWVIDTWNGEKLSSTDFPNGLPRLELFTTEGRVLGFDGCNSFKGSFYEKDSLLYFSPSTITLKACKEMPASAGEIVSSLNGGRFSYKWTGSRLILFRGDSRIELRPID